MSWLVRSIANNLRLDDDDYYAEEEEEEAREDKAKSLNDVVENTRSSINASHGVDEESAYEEIDLEDRFDSSNINNNEEEDHNSDSDSDAIDHNRGVKEDLSELKETLARQLWGVASFLAPPPPPPPPPLLRRLKSDVFDSDRIQIDDRSGLTADFDEEEEVEQEEEEEEYVGDGGGFVEYSNYKDYEEEEEEEDDSVGDDAVGVTDEVLAFAMNIAHHPETWLDFPLSDEEEFDDFEISDAQQKHAFAVERRSPRLAALRIELCPAHMTEGYFWMVYFVLLYSRLNKHDAELLSTPQLVEARAMWMQELQKKTKPESDWFEIKKMHARESTYSPREDFDSTSSEDAHSRFFITQRTFSFEPPTGHTTPDTATEKHPIESTEIQFIDKAVIEEDPPSKIIEKEVAAGPSFIPSILDYDEHEDDWLDDNSDLEGYSGAAVIMGNDDDVSFSDLEDDIDCTMPIKPKLVSKDYSASLNAS